MDISIIGQRINDLMVDNDVTYRELCNYCQKEGVKLAPSNLTNIINGVDRSYGYKIFVCIAEYFNVSVDYILGLTKAQIPLKHHLSGPIVREISDYTNLSEDSISSLHNNLGFKQLSNGKPIRTERCIAISAILDEFLKPLGLGIYSSIAIYKHLITKAVNDIKKVPVKVENEETFENKKAAILEALSYLYEAKESFNNLIDNIVPERLEYYEILNQWYDLPLDPPIIIGDYNVND